MLGCLIKYDVQNKFENTCSAKYLYFIWPSKKRPTAQSSKKY